MKNYELLKNKLSSFSGLSDEQIRNELNSKNININVPIPTSKIKAYLQVVGKRIAIKDSTTLAGRTAETALTEFEVFDITDTNYLNTLTVILDNLIAENIISITDKDVILSLGNDVVSWVDQNWYGEVTLTDIVNARNYV